MMLRPCKGRSCRKDTPPYALLAAEGENVDLTQYMKKRIARGDVEQVPTKPAHPEHAKGPKAVD